MTERWRPVRGYSNLYSISDHGRVRSLSRRGTDGRRLKGKLLSVKGTGPGGRPRVCLYKNNRRVWKLVYRLVLEAFVGPCPRGMEARHYPDPEVTNCNLSNLLWGTKLENMQDMVDMGRVNKNRTSDGKFTWRRA